MPIELECKLAVASHEPIRARLRELGARRLGHVLETNRLLDRPDGSLRAAGCGLRVRTAVSLDGGASASTLTFKGPRRLGRFKEREELETAVNSADAMAQILAALGFSRAFVFEKRRESWQLDNARIELDELPLLGPFVEVEGENESLVESTVRRLGLDPAASIIDSYVSLLAARVDADDRSDVVLRFDAGA